MSCVRFVMFRCCFVMPEICRFLDLIILMYYSDHNPPHIHVKCGKDKAIMFISDLHYHGVIPSRHLRFLRRWVTLHRAELLRNWDLLAAGFPPHKISIENK